MTTIKSYTDLEQSKKLAEILPPGSADMYWFRQVDSDYFPPNVESICPIPLYKDGKEDFNYDIRCWSLAALLNVIPQIEEVDAQLCKDVHSHKWHVVYTNGIDLHIDTSLYINPVDACVDMIERLHELKML